MFYIIESQHHKLVGMLSYPGSGWGLEFTKGKRLDPNFGQDSIRVLFESDHEHLPDYFELDETPIVSEKFVNVWKSLAVDNYQLFPVTIKFPASKLKGYYILNIVGLAACIDLDASDLSMYKNVIARIKNLVVDSDTPKLDLFRAKDFPLAIFISERIQKQLTSANLSGILMKPADGWNDKHRF